MKGVLGWNKGKYNPLYKNSKSKLKSYAAGNSRKAQDSRPHI